MEADFIQARVIGNHIEHIQTNPYLIYQHIYQCISMMAFYLSIVIRSETLVCLVYLEMMVGGFRISL